MPQCFVAGGANTLRELEAHDGQRQAVRGTRRAHRRAAPPAVVLAETCNRTGRVTHLFYRNV